VKKILFVLCCLALAVMLAGCDKDHTTELENIAEKYSNAPDPKLVTGISEIIDRVREDREMSVRPGRSFSGTLSDSEVVALHRIIEKLVAEKEFDVIYDIYVNSSNFLQEKDFELLHNNYHGDNDGLNFLIARELIKKNKIKSAFNRATQAALKNNEHAEEVRGLLRHYGCMSEDAVWAELHDDSIASNFSLHPGGGGYPQIPVSEKTKRNLSELRKLLREGKPPVLSLECPINLYD